MVERQVGLKGGVLTTPEQLLGLGAEGRGSRLAHVQGGIQGRVQGRSQATERMSSPRFRNVQVERKNQDTYQPGLASAQFQPIADLLAHGVPVSVFPG